MAKKTLRAHRRAARLTQQELADRAGMAVQSVRRFEKSADHLQAATYKSLKSMADAMKINVWDIDMRDPAEEDNEEFDPTA